MADHMLVLAEDIVSRAVVGFDSPQGDFDGGSAMAILTQGEEESLRDSEPVLLIGLPPAT